MNIASSVLAALNESSINWKVYLVGRRGPVQAACTTKELREILGIKDLYIHIRNVDLLTSSSDEPMVDEFPERPGQPQCKFYLKTWDCKYRSSCKFNHPKTLKTHVTLNEEGLPLRPGQSICSHFSRFGICKFGPSCKYGHSVTNDI